MMRERKLPLRATPKVSHNSYSCVIYVETAACVGQTHYTYKGELGMQCAANLIVELRRALRAIRKERLQAMDEAILKAEGPV